MIVAATKSLLFAANLVWASSYTLDQLPLYQSFVTATYVFVVGTALIVAVTTKTIDAIIVFIAFILLYLIGIYGRETASSITRGDLKNQL